MRVRLNRCHQTGSSNRGDITEHSFPGFNRAASVADSASGKLAGTSNSLSKTAAATAAFKSTVESISNRKQGQSRSLYSPAPAFRNTFTLQQRNKESVYDGEDMQLQSGRFNADSFRANEMALTFDKKIVIPTLAEPLGQSLNKEVKEIKEHFESRDINMHKLREIKKAFLKNFADKHRVRETYDRHAGTDGKMGFNGVRQLVKEFGFDVNDDEIRLMLSLTNNRVQNSISMGIEDFISLTSKPNIYFQTLKLKDQKELRQKPRTFSKKVHLILRNSFLRLKQAMRIYDQQGIPLNHEQFKKMFKKLDLTDLVISDAQIKEVYDQFTYSNGTVNQEKLLCAIAQQENINVLMKKRAVDVQFEDYVGRHKEIKDEFERTYLKNVEDLRRLSNNDYEKELKRIRLLSSDIKKVFPQRTEFEKKLKEALKDNESNAVSREVLADAVEKVLQHDGLNYRKHDYEALMSTLRYNTHGQAKMEDIGQSLYQQSPEELDDRMDRRCRNAPPNLAVRSQEHSNEAILSVPLKEGLRKIDEAFLHDELAKTFKQFDSDHDGYVSVSDFQGALVKKRLLSSEELESVTKYLDCQNKGYLTFQELHERLHSNIVNRLAKTNLPTLLPRSTARGGWLSSKRNFIQTVNQYEYNVPSKYSAWPSHLTIPDLSLVQPNGKSGMFVSEKDRFNTSQKDSFGQECKQRARSIQQAKVHRRMAWQQTVQQRIDQSRESELRQDQQTNQLKRLAQEIYQRNCHKEF